MVFFQILKSYLKSFAVPIFKSIHKAYTESIKKPNPGNSGSSNNNANDPFGKYFSEAMSKANLTATPMTQSQALKILNVQPAKQTDPQLILQRYHILIEKNDPKVGGSLYLQCKIQSAKQFLLNNVENIQEIQKEYLNKKKQKQNPTQNPESTTQSKNEEQQKK